MEIKSCHGMLNTGLASEYKESGVYENDLNYYIVSKQTNMVYTLSKISFPDVFIEDTELEEPSYAAIVDINNMLKLIAVAQKPELIKDIL